MNDMPMLKGLGAKFMVDFTAGNLAGQVRQQFPNGIDGLIDLVSDPATFAENAALVRGGGVALTSNFVADSEALKKNNVGGGNFVLGATPALIERVGASAGKGTLKASIQKRVPFAEGVAAVAAAKSGQARGKTVIVM